jgi:hypothetical protein
MITHVIDYGSNRNGKVPKVDKMRTMSNLPNAHFDEEALREIRVNQSRTPTERFKALCALLEAERAKALHDLAFRERLRQAQAVREKERKAFRALLRRIVAAEQSAKSPEEFEVAVKQLLSRRD